MSPTEMLSGLRARGVELRLADGAARLEARGPTTDNDRERIRAERLWLLMLLPMRPAATCTTRDSRFLPMLSKG